MTFTHNRIQTQPSIVFCTRLFSMLSVDFANPCWPIRARRLRSANAKCGGPYLPQFSLTRTNVSAFAICRKIKNWKYRTFYEWWRFTDSLPCMAWPPRRLMIIEAAIHLEFHAWLFNSLTVRWDCWPVSLLKWLTAWLALLLFLCLSVCSPMEQFVLVWLEDSLTFKWGRDVFLHIVKLIF